MDLALNPDYVTTMLDRLAEWKCAFWERALKDVGDLVTVVVEADDLAGQQSMLMSPKTYRRLIKPYHQRLFSFIKGKLRSSCSTTRAAPSARSSPI